MMTGELKQWSSRAVLHGKGDVSHLQLAPKG